MIFPPFTDNYSFFTTFNEWSSPEISSHGKFVQISDFMTPQMSLSVDLLRKVIETAPIPIAIYTGHDFKIELANTSMMKAWGKGDSVIGKSYREILPELQDQQVFDELSSVFETGKPVHISNKRLNIVLDGKLIPHYISYSFTPLYNESGELYGVLNMGYDITDLAMERQKTAEAEVKLRLALESAELGAFETDLTSNVTITTAKFNDIWGIDHYESTEQLISRIHPDHQQVRAEAHRTARETGKLDYEVKLLVDDNHEKWVKVSGAVVKDDHGYPLTLLGIAQDITEQKQFTEQLTRLVEKRTRDLKRSNEDLMQFAHVVSHDLKEPVRKIKMFNSVLQEEFQETLDQRGATFLNKVGKATDRMFSLIDGVLSYSGVNAASYSIENVELKEIIEQIKTDLELVIQEKQAILICDELPDMQGSPVLIRQLFYNLINNALKFSKSTVPPRVTIKGTIFNQDGEKWVEIVVQDNGIGIEADETNKIFEAFKRLHSKDEFEGTGLGLALCKKIVERHSGSIEVKSVKHEGTDFIVKLPLRQPLREI